MELKFTYLEELHTQPERTLRDSVRNLVVNLVLKIEELRVLGLGM